MHSTSCKIRNLLLDNNILLAPMAGISDLPYRLVMKRHGAALVFTEMVSANGLIRGGKLNRTRDLLVSRSEERPLAVQLFGDDPATLAAAAQEVASGADLIDINMGCPVPKVVRSGAGSALLRDPQRIGRIVAAVRAVWSGPLTVKIRTGWETASSNFLEVGRIAVAEGVDAVTLHPRSRAQGFSGTADWSQITALRTALPVPVIGSGDLFDAGAALRMLRETGCAAVMIGRGGYGNPWLFDEIAALRSGRPWHQPTAHERAATVREHLRLSLDIFGERKGLADMRKHLCWYARSLSGAAAFRTAVNRAASYMQLQQLAEEFFTQSSGPEVREQDHE